MNHGKPKVKHKKRGLHVGCDIGNTYCSIAYHNENNSDRNIVIVQCVDDYSIPTCISFNEWNGKIEIKFGSEAKTSESGDSKIYCSKRLLSYKFDEFLKYFNATGTVIQNIYCDKKFIPMTKVFLSNKFESFKPEEVGSILLHELLKLLPKEPIEKICFSIPVKGSEQYKQSLIRICAVNEINEDEILFIHESTASILAYQQEYSYDLQVGSNVMVIDFGGGTLDVSCCRIEENPDCPDDPSKNIIRVLVCDGDEFLGGNNFDLALGKLVKTKINDILLLFGMDPINFRTYFKANRNHSIDEMKRKFLAKSRFDNIVEKKKKEFSEKESIICNVHEFIEEIPLNDKYKFEITKEEFEDAIIESRLLENLIKVIKRAMNKNEVKWKTSDISHVLLVGGTCQIPIVRKTLTNYFGPDVEISPDKFISQEAVVKGATIYAHEMKDERTNVIDTLPFSIYAHVLNTDEYFDIFVEGDQLPKSEIKTLVLPLIENQFVLIDLYRKYPETGNSKLIDSFSLTNHSKERIGAIKFSITRNGITKITLLNDGKNEHKNIISSNVAVKDEEIKRMMEHLKPYLKKCEKVSPSYSSSNLNLTIPRNYIPEYQSVGICYKNEDSSVYFRDIPSNSPQLFNFSDKQTIDNYLSVKIKDNSLILSKSGSYPLKLDDIGKCVESKEFRNSLGMIWGLDNYGYDFIGYFNIKDQYYSWELFATYFDEINTKMMTRNSNRVGNVVMAIPNFIDDKTMEYLNMGLCKSKIDHIELVKQTYAAMIWFNHEHKGLLQKGNKVKVINFLENECEMDIFEIKNKINDIIVETVKEKKKEEEKKLNIDISKIDELMKEYLMQKIEDENEDYYEQYIKCSNEERKQKAMNKIMIEINKLKQELLDKKRDYPFQYDIIDNTNEVMISKDVIIEEIKNQMKEQIKDFINSNQTLTDYIIVIIDEFYQIIIESILKEIFIDKEIHFMTPEEIGKGACQRAIEIHDFGKNQHKDVFKDKDRYNIEFGVEFNLVNIDFLK